MAIELMIKKPPSPFGMVVLCKSTNLHRKPPHSPYFSKTSPHLPGTSPHQPYTEFRIKFSPPPTFAPVITTKWLREFFVWRAAMSFLSVLIIKTKGTMKNQIFKSTEFGQIRTCNINGATYFVGKDVADALGIRMHRRRWLTVGRKNRKGVAKRDPLYKT